MSKKQIGTIVVPPGIFLEKHEKLTADFLAVKLGHDITFLVANRRLGARTPDIEMDGRKWEIKSPKGKSSRVIENTLRDALKQQPNIILDLRRTDGRIPEIRFIKEIERQFRLSVSIRNIIVITREHEYIDFSR